MHSVRNLTLGLAASLSTLTLTALPAQAALQAKPAEIRAIAKEAYVYGFPLVDSYRILHAYTVDKTNHEYKAPPNQITSVGRVFTPEDKAVQTPNSDTPYSMVSFDLRSEPLVLGLPAMEKERYFSIQFVDAYTFNFAYAGSRTTGNDGGKILLVGPRWQGKTPAGISKVVRAETELGIAIYRTQLFNPADIDKVRKIQAAYTVQPLSAFLGQAAPKAAPAINYLQPLTPETQKTSLEFFNILNFVLHFCPTHPSEQALMSRFARAGIGAGGSFDISKLSPAEKQAFQDGIADAWKEFDANAKLLTSGKLTMGNIFGNREHLQNNYAYRFTGAVLGIWANSVAEAMYPAYRADHEGLPLDGKQRYVLRFPAGQLPPVNAFWSITMYQLPESLLYANPLNRYLINSPMLPQLKRDADGGITIYVQNASPGKDMEANWLPAPQGPFWLAMRLYWPKPEALDGKWKQPPLQRQ